MTEQKTEISIRVRQIDEDTYYASSAQLSGLHVESETIEDVFEEARILAMDLISLDETSPYFDKKISFDLEVV